MNTKIKKLTHAISRRKALGFLGIGGIATQFPHALTATSFGSYSPMEEPLYYKTITEVSHLIKTKKISSVNLTQLMLNRIREIDHRLHSYVTVMSDSAIETARNLDAELGSGKYRGALHGIPIGIKDLLFTKGVRTMAGTTVLSNFIPEYDATVVKKLADAGAVNLGKLTLCEGAQAPYHPDLHIPVNPWDSTKWSGVSSSGSGVATAAGLCFGSIGTDTGGSIRYPSAVNGCVGLKPTYGRVSRYGVLALAESMDHIGPMTRSVEDAVILYEAMAGHDPYDPTSLNTPISAIRPELKKGIRGLRIGFDRNYSLDDVDNEVANAIEQVLSKLEDLGAQIVEVTMPDTSLVGQIWYTLGTAEAALANESTFPSRADDFGPGFRGDLEFGLEVSGVDYARFSKFRAEISEQVHQLLQPVDCMVCPSMSNAARAKSVNPHKLNPQEWERLVEKDVFSKPFNFSGVPTLSVPCGFSKENLPLSVQFVGARLREAMICRIGYTYEINTDWHKQHPEF